MPTFSVIIPTYNRSSLLRSALQSVVAQPGADLELIVVDDGSTDDTAGYLPSLGDRIKVLQQSRRGPGAARNLGARHASGTYLAFLDSDDVWFPWTLETYREAIRQNHNVAFMAGKPYRFRVPDELDRARPEPIGFKHFPDYLASGDEWRWWGVSSFVIRRDAFVSVGGFTDDWVNGEDGDLALRLGVAGAFVQIVSPVTFGYREHEGTAISSLDRTLAGVLLKVDSERSGRYPGGSKRARERRRILTRHTRPVVLSCLRQGRRRDAWRLYRATFLWNAMLGRLKYLAAFPILALLPLFGRMPRPSTDAGQHPAVL